MSDESLMPTLDEIDAREVLASEKLNALCNGERFRMSIPVSATDADVVIGNALSDLRLLIARVREQEQEIAKLRELCLGYEKLCRALTSAARDADEANALMATLFPEHQQ